MIGIAVITHGVFSEQLVNAAFMIMGKMPDVKAVTFTADESIDDLRRKAAEAVEPYETDGCLILTDLMGGSASNVSIELMRKSHAEVITGVNLPMVLEAMGSRMVSDTLGELAEKVQASGMKSMINLREFLEKRAVKKHE